MHHPRRNEVFRDVGSEEHTPGDADFIELTTIPFDSESALLLCSDGLSDQIPSPLIRAAVERNAGNPEVAVRELIDAANRAGGKDNVTILIVEGEQFTTPPPPEPKAPLSPWVSRVLLFAAGFLVAAALGWLTRAMWQPAPVVIAPRVIVATTTIAAAMAEARPGDTVEVPGGEYREQVRLKDGVTLRARVPREPKLRAAPLSSGPAVIAEGVRGARFSGFRILADPRDAALHRHSAARFGGGDRRRGSQRRRSRHRDPRQRQPHAARQCDSRLPRRRRAHPRALFALALAQSHPGE